MSFSDQPLIIVRPLETPADFHAAEAVQRQVWPGSELDVLPLHLLTTVAHNGGLALGAFHDQRLVGFLFGFLGTDEGSSNRPALARLKHCSHQLGVLPEYRGQNIGYQLKLAQRDFVAAQGVRLITWTYDPLESRNARLNIAKLGAVCQNYLREVYGDMQDGLNAGLASDRFQVDWWVTSPRVKERLFGQRAPLVLASFTSAGAEILNPTSAGADGLPRPSERVLALAGSLALIEIPPNFQSLKAQDMGLAAAWRGHTRSLFEAAFNSGYWVTDFFHETVRDRQRSFYALSRGVRLEYSEN
jgi:predicted GNAT superfamily acetyltransferase